MARKICFEECDKLDLDYGYCPLFKRGAEGKIGNEFIYILGD